LHSHKTPTIQPINLQREAKDTKNAVKRDAESVVKKDAKRVVKKDVKIVVKIDVNEEDTAVIGVTAGVAIRTATPTTNRRFASRA
jgi:hypothetical protein